MNLQDIKDYLALRPQLTQEVFAKVILGQGDDPFELVTAIADKCIGHLNESLTLSPVEYLQQPSAMEFFTVGLPVIESNQIPTTWLYKLVAVFFVDFTHELLAKACGLNEKVFIKMARTKDPGYVNAVEGMLIAGTYNKLQQS
jgi:hypothetical protein